MTAGGRAAYLVGQLDVDAARGLVAPASRHVADSVATAAEDQHGLAVPEEKRLQAKANAQQAEKRLQAKANAQQATVKTDRGGKGETV